MDLTLLHAALGVPEDEGRGALVRAARKAHHSLPNLVFSALETAGEPLTEATTAELARGRRRAARYAELLDVVLADAEVRVVKGTTLAASYPRGILRPQVDLDLVTQSEEELWRVVRLVLAHAPVQDVDLSVVGGRPHHLLVSLSWPAEDALLDHEMKVEVSTAALFGDFGSVPVRAALPADEKTACLLAIAEERFQRPFHVRDALDVFALGITPDPVLADAYHLAPELTELFAFAAQRVPVEPVDLGGADELARRAAYRPPPAATRVEDQITVPGRLVGGLRLAATDRAWHKSRLHGYDGGCLLLTPVGDFLLVDSAVVTQDHYVAALAVQAELEGR